MNKKQQNIQEKMEKKKYEFWLDSWARRVAEREKKLKRGLKILRTESGLGASGVPHIGSFGDVLRQYGVTLALQDLGLKSELIAFCDDRDGLRKVPLGFPDWLEDYIGKPVTDIPDPFKCHKSFGAHMSSMLVESLEKAGIKFRFMSGYEIYKIGVLNEQIEKILLQSTLAGKIIKKILGQEKFTEMLPYLPTCENCGKIYTTRSYEILPKEHKILYSCDLEFLGKNKNTGKDILVKGCGHKGETSYFNANGKLAWKVEFAARWCTLGIVFEAHGKDILDSVKVNDEICRRILCWEPPLHFVYEMFLDKGGKKISKSIGNVLSPQVWFKYATPESLILLMLKRSEGTREINVTDILTYMDDVDRLEDVYFGLKEEKNQRDLFNAKRLFEFVHLLKTPKKVSLHVPYNTMIEIAKILPEKNQVEFALEKLKEFGHIKKVDSPVENEVRKRLEFAKNWNEDFLKAEVVEMKLSAVEKKSIIELIAVIEKETDGEKLQYKIFEIAKTSGIKPVEFFKLIYKIILNSERGPRLGHYIIERGKKEIVEKLKDII